MSGPTAYKKHARCVPESSKAQQVAKNIFHGWRKIALDIKNRQGKAAARG